MSGGRTDMSPGAIEARLRAACPPDLRPEHRLHHKLDMSEHGIERRLRQVADLWRLGRWLSSRRDLTPSASADDAPPG